MSLTHLGLDPVAQSVYHALLSNPDTDFSRMAGLAGVTEDEARTALDQLARLALVRWRDRDLGAPALIDPSAALGALLAREQSEITARQVQIEESRAAIRELLAAREAASRDDETADVERLVGLESVRARIDKLAQECQEEVWSFNPGGPQSEESLNRARPLNLETLARGIQMRVVYQDSARNDETTHGYLKWLAGEGAEVRTVPALPIRMIIVDRRVAVVPMDERRSTLGALVVSGRGMMAGMVALFQATWRTGQPLGQRRGREPGRPNAQERAALCLWAQGATDAMVARSLGISERTVRRMSENLTDRLGARSRFETGARAMDAGWLTSEDLA